MTKVRSRRPKPSFGGRYWVRTSDLFGVNEARYHCANRPGASCSGPQKASARIVTCRTASPGRFPSPARVVSAGSANPIITERN